MHRVHLASSWYAALQNLVHAGHVGTADLILRLLDPDPGDMIVEIGCGTGIFARHVLDRGFRYVGVDIDADRIKTARRLTPEARFDQGDVLNFDWSSLPYFRHAFIHGTLHHLDDAESMRLIDRVLGLHSDIALAIIEPFRPDRSWLHPVWATLAALDEGAFVRRLPEWASIYGDRLEVFEAGRWARWPVRHVVSLLTTHEPAADGLTSRHARP